LLLPISALTIAQSLPLVYLVFSHTRLHGPDLAATASTLAFFSIGMFAWGAQNILARGFYATRDTITPAVVGTITTLLSLPVYWLLVRRLDYVGLALASTIGIVAYTVLLFVLLARRTKNPEEGSLIVFFLKVALASAAAGCVCYRLTNALENLLPWQHIPGALLLLTVVTCAGILLLIALLKLFRVPEVTQYLRRAYQFASRE
jgi:putative peptidoglycan lipid II flippase